MDIVLVRAQGKLVTLLVHLLERTGALTAREVSLQLNVFSIVVAESDPEEGRLLALWAAMIGDSVNEDR